MTTARTMKDDYYAQLIKVRLQTEYIFIRFYGNFEVTRNKRLTFTVFQAFDKAQTFVTIHTRIIQNKLF